MRRARDTIIGSRLQVRAPCVTFRGAIRVGTIVPNVESKNSDSLLPPTTNDQFGSGTLARLVAYDRILLCPLGRTVMSVSEDTESLDSFRKVLVRRVREMDHAVNWLHSDLVAGKGS